MHTILETPINFSFRVSPPCTSQSPSSCVASRGVQHPSSEHAILCLSRA